MNFVRERGKNTRVSSSIWEIAYQFNHWLKCSFFPSSSLMWNIVHSMTIWTKASVWLFLVLILSLCFSVSLLFLSFFYSSRFHSVQSVWFCSFLICFSLLPAKKEKILELVLVVGQSVFQLWTFGRWRGGSWATTSSGVGRIIIANFTSTGSTQQAASLRLCHDH